MPAKTLRMSARVGGTHKVSVPGDVVIIVRTTETGAQVIVRGKRWATLDARTYATRKRELMPPVLERVKR